MSTWSRALAFVVVLAFFLAHAQAEDEPKKDDGTKAEDTQPKKKTYGTRVGSGVGREQMWPAATAEEWKKPVLIQFQRTWEDARAISKQTGKPILCCINMDGEIASEHYAGVRYRQPEIAELYKPYVCVIASVYRHNPRDYDDQGRRILCPRFGSVTCGEHITIEPILYDKFLDGRRIAPRHIGVEDGEQEMYDVFYAWDTDSVFETIREGVVGRPPPTPLARGDMSLEEQVASPDVEDRRAVEQAYAEGSRAQREALLAAAATAGEQAPVELLRLALRGRDGQLVRRARQVLAGARGQGAVDLLVEQLAEPLEPDERDSLLAALEDMGEDSPRARTVAVVHRGLAGSSTAVDAAGWLASFEGEPVAEVEGPRDDARRSTDRQLVERQAEILASPDADAQLRLAEAFLATAWEETQGDEEYARLLYLDARRVADLAAELGAYGWRVDSLQAVAAWYLGQEEEARELAVAAVEGGLPTGTDDWNTMVTLALFAQARQEAIRAALRAKEPWPRDWIADVHATCLVLARHPHGTSEQIAAHHDFLRGLGAPGQARDVLEAGLARFPDDWGLHERLRRQVLVEEGVDALEAVYADRLTDPGADPVLGWYAAQASFVAAEFHRRAGHTAEAVAAYDRAIERFEADIAARPDARDGADHQVALALAGKARLAFEAGDDEAAVAGLVASFDRFAEAAATLDGLNLSPADTARTVRAHLAMLHAQEDADETPTAARLARLEAAMDALDPRLLQLPAYEKEVPPPSEDDPPKRQPRGVGRRQRLFGG